MCPQEAQISIPREHDLINGLKSIDPENRVTNVACYDLAVCHDELFVALPNFDAQGIQNTLWNPCEFRTCVHNQFNLP